ncbi:MAG: Uma2 family endonuclease [Nostoc sp.]|uniref:Uma2 family endonuclease n=1 Tax=Nostoc sp. TaxID=1180 RepID=UPI002FF446D6
MIQLPSESDRLQILQDKMQEYIDNGTQLGWLIDRKKRQIFIYRPNIAVEVLDNPKRLCGKTLLRRFILHLSHIC